MIRNTYTAWRLDNTGASIPCQTTAGTLEGVAAETALLCQRKEGFHVLHRDCVAERETLHIYRVKWSKVWRYCPEAGHTKQFDQPKAEHVAAISVEHFAPVLRWQWTPGCDAVGAPAREIVL